MSAPGPADGIDTLALVDAYIEARDPDWGDQTYAARCSELYQLVRACPCAPQSLEAILGYLTGHTSRDGYVWDTVTLRTMYQRLRALYAWARREYPGGAALPDLPPPSDPRIRNFGRKQYHRVRYPSA